MNRNKTNNLAIEDFRTDSEIAFGLLYEKYFPRVRKFILSNKGKIEDAEDVFQDSLLILYEKLYAENFQTYTCLGNYISGIAKNLWLKKLNNRNFYLEISENFYSENMEEINQAIEDERNYWVKLEDYMKKNSDHCQNLVHDIFFKYKKIEEIQAKYKYTTKHNAQNQKHKCVEQIKKIKEKDELKNKK